MRLMTEVQTYAKEMLTDLKGKRDESTILVGDFHDPLSAIYGASR